MLALCHHAAGAGDTRRWAQRGLRRLHPPLRRGRPRPVRAGRGRRRRHPVAGGRHPGRHLRARRRVGPPRRLRRHPRALAPVDGPLHGGRMAGLPGRGPVLQPLREDRGHGHRPRGGAGRRTGGPDRRARAEVGHRPRPHPAVRGQRGHARGDHRGPVPGPPGPRGRGAAGLRVRLLRRRPRRLPGHPAPRRHSGRPPPLRPDRVRAGRSTSPTPTS